jgi:alkylation response protein AidB-like acyl-CoA dehydrogenase
LEDIARERKLTAEERQELKQYQRLADAFTPLAKGMNSEYANQNAYDCIQVHGGSGFMLEYACQRIYRDARITSIYEGTTQLQTVAAIRYVTNGFYAQVIEEYLSAPVHPEFEGIHRRIKEMATKLNVCTAAVKETDSQEVLDICARHLYEMAASTIMSLLLLRNTMQAPELFAKSMNVYLLYAESEVEKHFNWIRHMNVSLAEGFRQA